MEVIFCAFCEVVPPPSHGLRRKHKKHFHFGTELKVLWVLSHLRKHPKHIHIESKSECAFCAFGEVRGGGGQLPITGGWLFDMLQQSGEP